MGSFNRKRGLIWLESLMIPMLILGFLVSKCGVYFEMNDDRIINEIFAGVLTGTPDGHAIFVNYLLGGLLSFGYSLNGAVPWYGILLILGHLFAYWSYFGLILERCKNLYQHILGVISGVFLILANMYLFGQIQYTSTAIVIAAAGYLWLLFDESKKRKYIFFFLFELFALLLRSQSMLMVQPIGGFLFGISLLMNLKEDGGAVLKEQIKKGLVVVGLLLVCFGLSWFGNYVVGDYGTPEWKEYTHFREIRGDMADYYGFPDYEKESELFAQYQVSENEYNAFIRYWMLGNEIDIECLEKLHEIAKADYEESRSSVADIFKSMLTSRFQGGIVGYGKYTLVLYAFASALALFRKQWGTLLSVLGLNLSRNAVLAYLLYRGRLPFRVLGGLYFIEVLFLMAWMFVLLKDIFKERLWLKIATGLVAMASVVIFAESFSEVYSATYWTNYNSSLYSKGLDELIEYCQESDSGYICSDLVTAYYTGNVLDMDWYTDRNYLMCGFWCSQSPGLTKHQKEYLEEHKGRMRLLDLDEEQGWSVNYARELITDDWGLGLEMVDKLTLCNGMIIYVYDIVGEIEY